MNTETLIVSLSSMAAALGGLELVKYLLTRRSHARIARTEAMEKDFGLTRQMIEFLQEQWRHAEERELQHAQRVRELTDQVAALTREKARAEAELALKRCERRGCPTREPLTGY